MDKAFDIYSGDPRIFLSENGSRLYFIEGQPVLDQGIENSAFIDLFTEEDWPVNALISDTEEKLGSKFLKAARGPITVDYLRNLEQAAEQSLTNIIYGNVTATATNPGSLITQINIRIEPPDSEAFDLLLTKNGINWQFQKINPAHARVK